jgi:hypothetical protein
MHKKLLIFISYLLFWFLILFGSYWYFVDSNILSFFSLKPIDTYFDDGYRPPGRVDSILSGFSSIKEIEAAKIKFMQEDVDALSFIIDGSVSSFAEQLNKKSSEDFRVSNVKFKNTELFYLIPREPEICKDKKKKCINNKAKLLESALMSGFTIAVYPVADTFIGLKTRNSDLQKILESKHLYVDTFASLPLLVRSHYSFKIKNIKVTHIAGEYSENIEKAKNKLSEFIKINKFKNLAKAVEIKTKDNLVEYSGSWDNSRELMQVKFIKDPNSTSVFVEASQTIYK